LTLLVGRREGQTLPSCYINDSDNNDIPVGISKDGDNNNNNNNSA